MEKLKPCPRCGAKAEVRKYLLPGGLLGWHFATYYRITCPARCWRTRDRHFLWVAWWQWQKRRGLLWWLPGKPYWQRDKGRSAVYDDAVRQLRQKVRCPDVHKETP